MTLPAYAMNVSSFPELYERSLVPHLFRPWAEALLERLPPPPGARVLDLACGTGIVTRLAKARGGAAAPVTGVDVSPPMLAVARAIEPAIEWREGNATALPLADASVDVVYCQQGLQFFPDRPAAAREMRRVLAPGGSLAVSTWYSLEEAPFFRELHRIAERHLGSFVDQRHSFGDGAALERLLADAGFQDVRVERLTRTLRFPEAAPLVHLNAMALVGMGTAGREMGDEERVRLAALIAEESAGALTAFADGAGLAFDLGSNIAIARR